ncbi:MAG: restriction endonuclease subunit S [Bacteroidetes bacterium CHB5]|nr:restriction endonuclease subunit S [Bacteroidetes bacterium CHB5]
MSKAKTKSKAWKHPKLGMIPTGWEVLRFADAFEFLPTNSFSRDQMTYNGSKDSVFNIHYGDIHATFTEQLLDFKKHLSQVPVIANNGVSPDEDELLQDGDLIIADASEDYDGVGECIELAGIGKRKVVAGLHTLAAREKLGKISPGFRAYLLKHPRVFIELKKLATGSKVYGISKTNVANLEVVVPPSDENHEIALILSTWDKAIEKTEQLIAQKQQLKKGLMQQLLTGKVRFKGFKKSKWKTVQLEEIIQCYSGGTPSRTNAAYFKGSIPWIKSGELNQERIFSAEESISQLALEETSAKLVPKGTLLLALYGATAGVVAITEIKAAINQAVLAIIPNKSCNKQFLFYALKKVMPSQLKKLVQGGQPNLSANIVKEITIRMPVETSEQKAIADFMAAFDNTLNVYRRKHLELIQQKRGLIQKLLTGEVRVKTK